MKTEKRDCSERNSSGGVLPYINHIGMCRPYRVGFLRRFGLKTGIDFADFGLESGMVSEGATGVYERIYRCNSKWVREEREICEFETDLKIFFCLRSNLCNDNIISA